MAPNSSAQRQGADIDRCSREEVAAKPAGRITRGIADSSFAAAFRALERVSPLAWLVVLGPLYAAAVVFRAIEKPLWSDELATFYIAQLESLGAVTTALSTGVEPHPPLTYWLSHLALRLPLDDHMALRLPQMIGMGAALVAVFALIKRHAGVPWALTATFSLFFSFAFDYAYEARPYALVFCFAALSLFAYASSLLSAKTSTAVWLWLWLALGNLTHYYAALNVLPFLAAEAFLLITLRTLRLRIWAAMAFSAVTLVPCVPLIIAARKTTGVHWARPYWEQPFLAYSAYLQSLLPFLVFAAALFTVTEMFEVRSRGASVAGRRRTKPLLAAALVFVALPFIGYFPSVITGAFVERYFLSAVLGLICLPPLLFPRFLDSRPLFSFALVSALLFAVVVGDARTGRRVLTIGGQRPKAFSAIVQSLPSELPVLVQDARLLMQAYYYAEPSLKKRLLYLADPKGEKARSGSDSVDRSVLSLAKYAGFNTVTPDALSRNYPQTLLYWDAVPEGNLVLIGWQLPALLRQGFKVTLARESEAKLLFRVERQH